jgi:HSP20 family protein
LTAHVSTDQEVEVMLMRTDPFREFDQLAQRLLGTAQSGTWSHPARMPLDAYRDGDEFVIAFDLPGVAQEAIDVAVERNVLTVTAERRPLPLGADAQAQVTERPLGAFARQVFLSDALATDKIQASYADGVLVLRIPVAEQAKPRKIQIAASTERKAINA